MRVCVCVCMCLHTCCEYLHIGPFTILPHGRLTVFLHPLWILHNYPGSSYLWHFTTLIHPWILLHPKLKGAWTTVCAYFVDLVHTDRITLSYTLTTIIFQIYHCNGLQLKECPFSFIISPQLWAFPCAWKSKQGESFHNRFIIKTLWIKPKKKDWGQSNRAPLAWHIFTL